MFVKLKVIKSFSFKNIFIYNLSVLIRKKLTYFDHEIDITIKISNLFYI